MLSWEDIEKWKGYHAGTSGSEFNLPDFFWSADVLCKYGYGWRGNGCKGRPTTTTTTFPELAQKRPNNIREFSAKHFLGISDTEYWNIGHVKKCAKLSDVGHSL